MPSGIRVIGGHCFCKLCCLGTKILFVNSPRFVDDESHHTRGAVLGGICDEGKSCGHLSVDDIILGSALSVRSLASENPEKIAIEGVPIADLVVWTFSGRIGDERVDRTVEPVVDTLPVQAIMPVLIAN